MVLGTPSSSPAVAARPAGELFAAELRRWRLHQRMTQEELAEASGLSVRGIRSLECGRVRAPRLRTASLLADALRLTGGDREGFLTLAAEPATRPGGGAGEGVTDGAPGELPAAINDLTGRDGELAQLAALARGAAARERSGPTVVVLHGLAGVGKTSLAVSAGHRERAAFGDGQLYVELGSAPEPAAALGRVLRSLGVPQDRMPRSPAERTALYRTLTRDRRLLVVVDNAVGEPQVRPLLPAGPGCLVLVTARRPLAGLESVERLALPVLDDEAAVTLLRGIAGARARAEPEATAELARLCGRLPLALRIAGNRLASRPSWTVGHVVAQLRDRERRLSALTAGDQGVREAFALSYARLSARTAMVFRRCAPLAGRDIDPVRAAAVTGLGEPAAVAALEELVDAGLSEAAGDRYRFHELVRLYAAEQRGDPTGIRVSAGVLPVNNPYNMVC